MLQSKTSAASSDVRMKAQICILEEQRQEVSTFQKLDYNHPKHTFSFQYLKHSCSFSFTQLLCINEKWAKEYHTMVRYYKERVNSQSWMHLSVCLLLCICSAFMFCVTSRFQVQDLKTLLQHDPLAVEICERGKNVTSNKKAKDKENTWVNTEFILIPDII